MAWGRPYLEKVISDYQPKVVLALGNVALRAATGLAGEKRGISHLRGFVLPSPLSGIEAVVGGFHPSFIRRGAMPLQSVLMHDIKLAVTVAAIRPGQTGKFFCPVLSRDFLYQRPVELPNPTQPTVPAGYVTYPTEDVARDFLKEVGAHLDRLIGYDIETPRSGETGEDESDELGDTKILSVQFSLAPGTGIYIPWREPFLEIVRGICASPNPKAGANTWRFDDPLLAAHGCPLGGVRHDVRWAWHHLQPDLRGALQFITSFYGKEMGPWKHLHRSHPMYYGIADVDAIQRILV